MFFAFAFHMNQFCMQYASVLIFLFWMFIRHLYVNIAADAANVSSFSVVVDIYSFFILHCTMWCSICEKRINSHFNRHIDNVHNNTKYPCHYCPKVYSNKGRLTRHIKKFHWKFCFLKFTNTAQKCQINQTVKAKSMESRYFLNFLFLEWIFVK